MSGEQMVCVKRPEPGLTELFEDMYINERLVDCTLSCSDGQIQAHRLVLAACSPYFNDLFDKLSHTFQYPFIVIKDMQIDDLKMIVDYMYRGQIIVSQEKLTNLIKTVENLQITGLSSYDKIISCPAEGIIPMKPSSGQRFKRSKRTPSTIHNQSIYNRAYRVHEADGETSPGPEKLLEQSMITGESLDETGNNQLDYTGTDPTSTRNLNNISQQHLSNPAASYHNQHLNNQLQVFSHSLSANRTSMSGHSSSNGQSNNQIAIQQPRGRVHPCNTCWKTFREKANLKRHLQVHDRDRVIYACPDCNKSFSWKDNYIRHTKTAHHINNVRPQS